MARILDDFADLGQDGLDYVKLRWASIRLELIDKLSSTLGKAFGVVLCVVFVVSAVVFGMVALALWIGEMMGSAWLGFLIAGGGLLLIGVIARFVGARIVDGGLVRHFVKMFFTEDDDYGTAG